MLILKEYQQRTLENLRDFFLEYVQSSNVHTAFEEITRRQYGISIPYRSVRDYDGFPKELGGLPYICLRIPTGGGKTIIACHSVSVATKYLLQADNSIVLWLVPSNTILDQTLNALKDRNHPYRQALETTTGSVKVLSITEALNVQRTALDSETVIIVSTIQAFRVDDTEGRKVYDSSGALLNHFLDVPKNAFEGLDTYKDGTVKHSLANVLRMRRPIVIVDEAHNARTTISFKTLARFNPSCIIELTATPDREINPSNVIYSVSAAELNAEDMIKLPIRVETRPEWKDLLTDAINRLYELDKKANSERQKTGEYIRPIMLIQAQPRSQRQDTVTVEVVEKCLVDDFKIPAGQIRRATGETHGLDDIDILSPDCNVRFVITVQALREGWDCPFAYILCSVGELHSPIAVEQLIGRIMRLPNAVRKTNDDLNMAYAFAASQSFISTLNALKEALVQNGFEKQEAKDLISYIPYTMYSLPFETSDSYMGLTVAPIPELPKIEKLPAVIAEKVAFDTTVGTITFKGVMEDYEREELKKCFTTVEGRDTIERVYRRSRGLPAEEMNVPAERCENFLIPGLAIKQGDLFEMFEETHFLETPWSLADYDATLSEEEYPSTRPEAQFGEINVTADGQIESRFLPDLQRQLVLLSLDQGWSVAQLVYWLDRKILHKDITETETGVFITRIIRYLIDERRLSCDHLVLDKFRLSKAIAAKINKHRENAYKSTFQSLLMPDSMTPLTVTPEVCFSFDPTRYPYSSLYDGAYKFSKHYYRQVGDLRSQGEEFECAQFLDSLPEVRFWVRNLERKPSFAFWLQTSTDKFYPDFVCELNDGRYLVVEYKGEDRWSNDDSKEKRNLGGLWEERSSGQCLFVMPKGKDYNAIMSKIGNWT